MEDILKGLNKEQKEAVAHGKGPMLVIAGAGTGKTTVITRRIAWLITQMKVEPSNILALTFTDKAAAEMETRVDSLVPYGYIDTWISTFHAFGDRLLRDHALDIGLSPNFQVLTQPEQAVFLRERIFSIDGLRYMRPLSGPTKHIQAIIDHISRLKDELITSERYLEFATAQLGKVGDEESKVAAEKSLEIAKIYAHYQQWMIESDQIDFGDQINLAIKLLQTHPDILKKYQKQFAYCLVDEFQDTNVAQNEMIKLLFGPSPSVIPSSRLPARQVSRNPLGKNESDGAKGFLHVGRNDKDRGQDDDGKIAFNGHQNITAVGDDDQSIYQFRGAAVQNIIDFQKTWKGTKIIVLNNNFRSQQAILDAAYKLIQHNNPDRLEVAAKVNKKLKGTGAGPEPTFTLYDDDFHEAKVIVDKIRDIVANDTPYSDIAILVRANSQAEPFAQQLRAAGLPYLAPGTTGLYDEPIVRLLISFAKVLADYDDYLALYYLATSEIYKVDTMAMTAITSYARHQHLHFHDLLAHIDEHEDLAKRVAFELNKLKKLNSDIEKFTAMARVNNVGEVIYKWLVDTELLKKLEAKSNDDLLARIDLENIASFYEKIKNFVRSSDNPGVMNFVANLRLLAEAGENPAIGMNDNQINAVNILTVHSAKGLEWPVVFMPSLSSDRFPSRHRQEAIPVPIELGYQSTNNHLSFRAESRNPLVPSDFSAPSAEVGRNDKNNAKDDKMPDSRNLHLREERRLFYVAMTRAKTNLYLSVAEKYGQGIRAKKASQFVYEALGSIEFRIKNEELRIVDRLSLFDTTEKREAVKKKFIKKGRIKLNPHEIDDYLTCPKKFDYIHILQVPIAQAWEVAYGNAIHQAIGFYYTSKLKQSACHYDPALSFRADSEESRNPLGINELNGTKGFLHVGRNDRGVGRNDRKKDQDDTKKPISDIHKVTLDDILKAYRAAWRSENFVTHEHEKQKQVTGEITLERFYEREEKLNRPIRAVEERFEFETGCVKISGRYDTVFDDGQKKLILDFKTSDVTEEKKADDRVKQSTQMQIYALAEETINAKSPEVALYFIESGIVAQHIFTDKELEKTKENIKKVVDGIKSEDFYATPSFNQCHWCAYKEICPYKFKGT